MSTGKWRQPGVPHTGWECVDVEELEDDFMVCEMCEVTHIRFVHKMQHPEYPEELLCGCVCAGNMEQDLAGAKRREATFKTRERRKNKLLTQAWKVSAKGNFYINEKGWNVVVYQKGPVWGGRISRRDSDETYFLRSRFPDSETAKRKALELLEEYYRHPVAQEDER